MKVELHVDPEDTIKGLKKQVKSLMVYRDQLIQEKESLKTKEFEAFVFGFWAGWEDDSGKPDVIPHWDKYKYR